MRSNRSQRLLVGVFANEHDVLGATRAAAERGLPIVDVYTPYAIEGLPTAMGLRRSRLTWVCFACGLVGLVAAIVWQLWATAVDWPINVGGRPWSSLPAFVPVWFEMTVLFAGLGAVLAFFVRTRLFPGRRARLIDPRVTDDLFVIVLAETSAAIDPAELQTVWAPFSPLSVEERVTEVSP